MNDEQGNKIIDAAETCLALALGQRDPFSRVSAYIRTLEDSDSWTDAEVMAVQARVIRALMKRIEAGDSASNT